MNTEKRVNVITTTDIKNKEGEVVTQKGMLARVSASYAVELVKTGAYAYTKKNKLKSFFNKQIKLYKNADYLNKKKIDLKDEKAMKKAGHRIVKDQFNGKTYVDLKVDERSMKTVDPKIIDHLTGKPKEYYTRVPIFHRRVINFAV